MAGARKRWSRAASRLNDLSLDVAVGAVAGGSLLAWALQADVPMAWWVVLGLSTWLAYALDHLLDTWRLGLDQAQTSRHRLYRRHRIALSLTASGVMAAALLWTLRLPVGLLQSACWVGLGVGLHLVAAQRWGGRFPKEASTALLYAAAVALAPAWSAGLGVEAVGLIALLVAAAWNNLVLLSALERDADHQLGQRSSLLERWGLERCLTGGCVLAVGATVWVWTLGPDRGATAAGLLCGVAALPLLLAWGRGRSQLARGLADGAFTLLALPPWIDRWLS